MGDSDNDYTSMLLTCAGSKILGSTRIWLSIVIGLVMKLCKQLSKVRWVHCWLFDSFVYHQGCLYFRETERDLSITA